MHRSRRCDYDETATGVYDYDSCGGCTDESASNYDPTVTLDDGSCEFPGCTLPQACNFDPMPTSMMGLAVESCLNFGCTNEFACNYDPDADLADNSHFLRVDMTMAMNKRSAMWLAKIVCVPVFQPLEVAQIPQPAITTLWPHPMMEVVSFWMRLVCVERDASDADADGICDDVDDCVGKDACGVCNGPGAILECGCTSIPEGDCDCDGNQVDAIGVCDGDCTSDEDCNGVCDDAEVPGCNIAQACNYEELATQDDGSCEFISCLAFGC